LPFIQAGNYRMTLFSHLFRSLYILWVLLRHDAFYFLEGKRGGCLLRMLRKRRNRAGRGENLRVAFEALGPAFIKLGQVIAMRPDLVDDDVITALTHLQDRVKPFSGKTAVTIIEQSFGQSIDTLFSRFDDEAVAAASIAQVHKARRNDGTFVAVKILRPDIHTVFARDIALLYRLAGWLEKLAPASRRLKPSQVVKTLQDTVAMELDLRYEAASGEELREFRKEDNPNIYIPWIDWERTNQQVLTLEWIDGTPIHDVETLKKQGFDLLRLTEKAAHGFFNMAFRDGVFHADLHGGNMLVRPDGQLVAVDFGITGRLAIRERMYLAEIFHGFLQGDYHQVAQAHCDAGYVPRHQSVENFALACRAIAAPIMGKPLSEVSGGGLLTQLFRVAETFEMELQPQLLLMQKSLILIEGIGRTLAPEANMWELAEPPIKAWAESHLTPQARIKLIVQEEFARLKRLPALLDALEKKLQS